jgi:integrase
LTIFSTFAAEIRLFRPGRGASLSSPSTPASAKRSRHGRIVGRVTPSSAARLLLDRPAAVRWGVVTRDPTATVTPPAEPPPRVRDPTPTELRKVQDAASPWLRPWIEAAVLTGWRLREQAELRWADVNEDWIFHRGQGKVPRVKARPVNRELADLL